VPVVPDGIDGKTLCLLRRLRRAFDYVALTGFEFTGDGEVPALPPAVKAGKEVLYAVGGRVGGVSDQVRKFDATSGAWSEAAATQTGGEDCGAVPVFLTAPSTLLAVMVAG
jgi:hypothetical protein